MKINFKKIIKKFLSKFKIIDLIGIGIFFTILLVAVVFFLRRSSFVYVTLQISQGEDAFHNFWFYKPSQWYIKNLSVGMANKDAIGKTDLELVDMYYYPNQGNAYSFYVTLKVKTVFNKRTQQHSYQGQPLLIGENRVFKLSSVSVPGMIHKISDHLGSDLTKIITVRGKLENKDHEYISNDAETRFLGIRNYLSAIVEPGLTIVNSKGVVVAKILDVKKSMGYREFIYQNLLLKVADSEYQVVEMTVELTLNEVNGSYLYMEEERVLIGNVVRLPFEDFILNLTVEEIAD